MNQITGILEELGTQWSTPKVPFTQMHEPPENQVPLKCEVRRRNKPVHIGNDFPLDLREMWTNFDDVILFADNRMTIWGLHLLSYDASAAATQDFSSEIYTQFDAGDVIVGRFFGDLDRLLVRCDRSANDFGNVVVVLRDGLRKEWYTIASSLEEFLTKYAKAEGDKYWEHYP